MKFNYHIKGMHCAACIEKIKLSLSPHFNVINITLNPPLLEIEADKQPPIKELNDYLLTAGKYSLQPVTNAENKPVHTNDETSRGLSAYYPIFLITAYIIGVATINNFYSQGIHWQNWMSQFMAGFFLVFSAFKMLDITGFADAYASYDLLAKRWHTYGYLYPFLELALGILYLTQWLPITTLLATVIIMGFSSIGVINSLLKKQKFQCACLGTLLKVPLSTITLIEDLTMAALAALALIMR